LGEVTSTLKMGAADSSKALLSTSNITRHEDTGYKNFKVHRHGNLKSLAPCRRFLHPIAKFLLRKLECHDSKIPSLNLNLNQLNTFLTSRYITFKIYFNSTFSCTPKFHKWSLPLTFN